MPVNVKQWLENKAAEAGIVDEAERAVVAKLLESKTFQSDFVALPDFHSALGKQKSNLESQIQKLTEVNLQWQDEYENKYAPALDAVSKLQASGFDTSGYTNDGRGGVTGGGGSLTPEQISELVANAVAQAVEPVRAGAIDFVTFAADKSADYRDEFGKKFNVAAYRKFAYDNRDKYPTLDSAYDAFTDTDRKAKEEADREKWKTETKEQLKLELMSASNLPEVGGVDGAPMFVAATSPVTEGDQERADAVVRENSRRAFVQKFAGADFTGVSTPVK